MTTRTTQRNFFEIDNIETKKKVSLVCAGTRRLAKAIIAQSVKDVLRLKKKLLNNADKGDSLAITDNCRASLNFLIPKGEDGRFILNFWCERAGISVETVTDWAKEQI